MTESGGDGRRARRATGAPARRHADPPSAAARPEPGFPAEMTSPPQSILVVSLRYFGDVLLTTSLIRTLRRGFPGAAIDVLLAAGTEEMLEGNPDVREVVTVAERPGIGGYRALIRRLARRYDLAVIAETGDRPHFYGYIAARRRAGLLPEPFGKRWWKAALVTRDRK